MADFSNAAEHRSLYQHQKAKISKNNMNRLPKEFSPSVSVEVEKIIASDGSEDVITLAFHDIKHFVPKQLASEITQLKGIFVIRNLLCDLNASLMDNTAFYCKLEKNPPRPVAGY